MEDGRRCATLTCVPCGWLQESCASALTYSYVAPPCILPCLLLKVQSQLVSKEYDSPGMEQRYWSKRGREVGASPKQRERERETGSSISHSQLQQGRVALMGWRFSCYWIKRIGRADHGEVSVEGTYS